VFDGTDRCVGNYHGDVTVTAPTAQQLAPWRLFLRAHAQLTRALEHDLLAEHDLPLASYDVLLQLAESPGRRLRMTELADRVLLSRSGLTRLVDRLERDGFVERQACPGDARGTHAVLTEAGLAKLRTAATTHLRGVAEHVTDRLTSDELAQLEALMTKLLQHPVPMPAGGCGEAEGL
jgi:DNA-binding MarR family transcriptional regulator